MLKTSFQFRWAAVQCSLPVFQALGYTGVAMANLLAMGLVRHADLSNWVIADIAVIAVVTFFVLVIATKVITGEERIIYYHHEIAVMFVAALLLRTMHQPLLPYLDITILGIGTFLTCGRIGCLSVGCCHGRPCRWGVRYGEEHAAAGFPSYLVGVRLFPIQAVESLWVLCTVAVGTLFVWNGSPPGTALAWYIIVYDAGRFCFEFARGDADRPYWFGFSQPQWISLVLTGGVAGAELAGFLPFVAWHLAAFILLAVVMGGVSLKRHLQETPEFRLLHPKHIRQLAVSMSAVETSIDAESICHNGHPASILIACTSLGIRISGRHVESGTERIFHYTISSREDAMTERIAGILAKLIRQLNGLSPNEGGLIAGSPGVFHVLIGGPIMKGNWSLKAEEPDGTLTRVPGPPSWYPCPASESKSIAGVSVK